MEILKVLKGGSNPNPNLQKREMQKDEKPNYGYEHANLKTFFVGLPQNFMQYIRMHNEMYA